MWRQNRWRTNVEFLSINEFELEKPELAKLLKEGHAVVCDELYAYRLSGIYVEKIWVKTYEQVGKQAFHIPREHFNHKQDPHQKRFGEG